MSINISPEVLWLATPFIVLAFLFYSFPIIRVKGYSMYPTYREGEFLLSSRLYPEIKVGDVVVVNFKDIVIVKRVKIKKGHRLFLEGDNKDHSMDSRHFGYIHENQVISKVLSPRKEKRNE